MAALPEIFEAAGLAVTIEEVEETARGLCPEACPAGDSLPYSQCQEVYLRLAVERRRSDARSQEPAGTGCVARWMATDTGATNFLLVIVVSLCSLSAFLAAGVAILLLFLDGLDTTNKFLQEDLGIFQDSIEVFAGQIASQMDTEEATTIITTLSIVVEYIGYLAGLKTTQSDLMKIATAVSNTLVSYLAMGQEQSFANYAVLAAALANVSLATYGLSATAAVFNGVNDGMPPSYEVLLAQQQGNAVQYLTDFRFWCPNGCLTNASVTTPMLAALSGRTFAQFVLDYTGYTASAGFSSRGGLGAEVKVDRDSQLNDRFWEIAAVVQGWTDDPNTSYEYLIGQSGSPNQFLAAPYDCDDACQAQNLGPGWPMDCALRGQTGVMQFVNHRGYPALAAYMPILGYELGLVVQMKLYDVISSTLDATVSILDKLNHQYAMASQEFELSTYDVQGSNATITHLTAYRYVDQCPSGQCAETPYVRQAVSNRSNAVVRTTDYRNKSVLVGYHCLSDLNAVLSIKVDVADNEADDLTVIQEAVDGRSAKDVQTSAKFLLATPKPGLTAKDVQGYGDLNVISKVKYPNACVHPNCTWDSVSALRALQGLGAVVESRDYRNALVKAAPSLSDAISYGIGLALETDSHELLQPMVDTAIKVGCFAGGMVVLSTLVLVLITKLFLRSMIQAKEEGQRAVEKEKDRFSKLVSSMYPAYVVPRLLEGQKQMVCEVPGAAVFFSDIHEFTSASNAMGSKDLLLLMGYVYGVMDHIADRFGVYKVKTIGDAYLAVLGLAGTTSPNVSLDLLRFASCVCQVFGDRFVHPTEGQVLVAMNKAMQWTGRAGPKKHSSSPSVANSVPRSGGRLSSKTSAALSESSRGGSEKVQCIMSYGLAFGKLVAGVLAGRCPMFDIWGATVNLASRMQSTGEPGRIQVSEQLYKKVIAATGQPFSFEPPRSTHCKGFGAVNAYLVRATAEGLPKDLQSELRLEPRYGAFYFENILSTFFDAPAGTVPQKDSAP
eukprot:EG_transcript_1000